MHLGFCCTQSSSRAVAGFSDIKACCQKEVLGAGLKEARDQNVGHLVLLTTSNPELGQKDRKGRDPVVQQIQEYPGLRVVDFAHRLFSFRLK